ncbi:RDD family protein [Nocardioides sp. cx-169]|uniref:RDD family protein n=1 Tax=Nocardioides sp. cx-169 TaxID=2899080 RepID=UPI001E2D7360|nr:RDD family protein [Nocardioides sp. cx-169]MCD4532831.1 RDD family protein [Nocardioides sp. cx-169]
MTTPYSPGQMKSPEPGPVAHPVAGSPGRRAAARLIDGLVLVPVALIPSAILPATMAGSPSGHLTTAVIALVNAATFLAYFSLMEACLQQTLGKRFLGLKVTTDDGHHIGLVPAVTRNIWVAFGVAAIIPLVGSLLGGLASLAAVVTIAVGISSDHLHRRGWHDRLAGGTLVVGV